MKPKSIEWSLLEAGLPITQDRNGFKFAYRLLRTEKLYIEKCKELIEEEFFEGHGMLFSGEFVWLEHSLGFRTKRVCDAKLFKAVCYAYESTKGRYIDRSIKG